MPSVPSPPQPDHFLRCLRLPLERPRQPPPLQGLLHALRRGTHIRAPARSRAGPIDAHHPVGAAHEPHQLSLRPDPPAADARALGLPLHAGGAAPSSGTTPASPPTGAAAPPSAAPPATRPRLGGGPPMGGGRVGGG